MKLSNFTLDEVREKNLWNREFFASVDVEKGFWFWRKVERKKIRREYGGYWHFVDNGEFVPGRKAEDLARAWKAKTGQEC